MKALVIDDDFESRHLLQKILSPFMDVEVATDGEEGVLAFQSALRDGEPFDLVTMDMLMPHSNGQQAMQEIREIEREKEISVEKAVKIIVISALDDTQEVHDAFFMGDATAYIVKPIRHQIVLDAISSLNISLESSKK